MREKGSNFCQGGSVNVRFKSWVQFLRLPAVLTVPGDLWVGAVSVGGELSLPTVAAVCLAYLFGMALNDLLDQSLDKLERPKRPLPSGAISSKSASWVAAGLLFSALAFYPGLPVLLLLGMIGFYNISKHWLPALFSIFAMASCRGIAVWIGAGAPPSPEPVLRDAIGFWMLLIAGITALARLENRPGGGRIGAVVLGSLWVWAGAQLIFRFHPLMLLPFGFWTLGQIRFLLPVITFNRVTPALIGGLLSLWIPFQSWVIIGRGQTIAGLLVLSLWPLLIALKMRIRIS